MTSYWRAKDIEAIVEQLVPEYHDHLDRPDVTIRCVFRKLVMISHDLEEFHAVVERHGLWRPDLKELARILARRGEQPTLDDVPDVDVRTSEVTLAGDSPEWSETWPASGMTCGGAAYRLPPWAPLTGGSGCSLSPGLLPTPTAARYGNNQSPSPGAAVRPSLDSITALLPTPITSDSQGGARDLPERRTANGPDHGPRLRDVAALLPTPAAADGRPVGTRHPTRTRPCGTGTTRKPATEPRLLRMDDGPSRWLGHRRAGPDPRAASAAHRQRRGAAAGRRSVALAARLRPRRCGMTATCHRHDCHRTATTRGWCEPDYRRRTP